MQVEELCSGLNPVLKTVELQAETIVEEDQFLFMAAVVYAKIVAILTSAYRREEECQANYEKYNNSSIEIFDWIKRLKKKKKLKIN